MTTDELIKSIKDERDLWHKRETLYRQAKEPVRGDPAACLHWFIWFLKMQRRLCRRFLRSRFHYDVERHRFLRLSPQSRRFQTDYEFTFFAVFVCEYINTNREFKAGWRAFTNAFWEEEDPQKIVAKTLAAISQEHENSIPFPLWLMKTKAFLGWEVFDKDVSLLSGWAAAEIDINLNSRLRDSLSSKGGDPRTAMLEELPGGVLQAMGDRQPGEWVKLDKKQLKNAVTELLAAEQPLEARINTLSEKAKAELATLSAPLDDFVLREEARSEIAQVERMKPTPREAELLNLLYQDPESSSSELAAKMDTTVGNIDRIKHGLRNKARSRR